MCGPKFWCNRNSFHMKPITELNTKLLFPSFLSTKTHLCIIYCFTGTIQAWYFSPGCTSPLVKKDNDENYLNKWWRKYGWRSFQRPELVYIQTVYTLIVFLKECFEKVISEKISRRQQTHEKLPSMQRIKR